MRISGNAVSRDNIISPSALLDKQSDSKDRQLMIDTIAHLVERNVLRYTTNGPVFILGYQYWEGTSKFRG